MEIFSRYSGEGKFRRRIENSEGHNQTLNTNFMSEWLSRTELLLGKEGVEKLKRAHVLVAGLGGVGAYAAEQLCRAGVGEMTLIDGDVTEVTNKNRQLLALDSMLGQPKADLMGQALPGYPSGDQIAYYQRFYPGRADDRCIKSSSLRLCSGRYRYAGP